MTRQRPDDVPPTTEAVLQSALARGARTSLRLTGAERCFSGLQVTGFQAGQHLELGGFRRRDRLPRIGALAQLAIQGGEAVLCFELPVLGAVQDRPERIRVRLGWPRLAVDQQPLGALRVAGHGWPALDALGWLAQSRFRAQVLNLAGSFVDLGLAQPVELDLRQPAAVVVAIPGCDRLLLEGQIIRFARIAGDALPIRFRLNLERTAAPEREALRGFLQARAMALTGRARTQFRLQDPQPAAAPGVGFVPGDPGRNSLCRSWE
jgi:hypothetical protein